MIRADGLNSSTLHPKQPLLSLFLSLWLCASVAMASAFVTSHAQTRATKTKGREAVVFVVTKQTWQEGADAQIEPAAFVDDGGALSEPVLGESSEENAPPPFFARYYRTGAKYRLVFGGAEAGSVTVREAARAECAPNAARVELGTTTAKLGGNVMALAVNDGYALRAQGSRRAPTEQERAAVFNLVKTVFTQKRVNASTVARGTKTLNLTATDLDGDGREELVGSYVVKVGPQTRDTLLLVAAPQGRGYRAALSKYARINAREMMDPALIDNVGEGGLGTELFVEQLDVDGDGVGELFTVSQSFEGTTYRAYRRQGGAWQAVYENYSYRCAY